jgi:uncharacterized membrane protein
MQKFIILLILLFSFTLSSIAQKDINAWKNEKNIEQQYQVFKKNLNYWNGNYFLNETQLNEYYRAFSDSVDVLEKKNTEKAATIKDLQNQLNSVNNQLSETKTDLETSIENRNSIEIFGININKGFYTLIMSVIIFALIVILVLLYFMYNRSNKVTVRTKKDYDELKEEFEVHKKDSLERYTKINMELHHTRLQLKKKL